MTKPPASIRTHQDFEGWQATCEVMDGIQYDKEYQYIRRDLVEEMMREIEKKALWKGQKLYNGFALGFEALTQEELSDLIDDFINHENKNTK